MPHYRPNILSKSRPKPKEKPPPTYTPPQPQQTAAAAEAAAAAAAAPPPPPLPPPAPPLPPPSFASAIITPHISPIKPVSTDITRPIDISEESKALIHEIETRKTPSEIPDDIFEEEIRKRNGSWKKKCLMKEPFKEPLDLTYKIKTTKPPTGTLRQNFERNTKRAEEQLQCSMKEPSKDPLVMGETVAKIPASEIPYPVFKAEIRKRTDESLKCAMEKPSIDPFVREMEIKKQLMRLRVKKLAKKFVNRSDPLLHSPVEDIAKDPFVLIPEIETKKPPAENPYQVFEEETAKNFDALIQRLNLEPSKDVFAIVREVETQKSSNEIFPISDEIETKKPHQIFALIHEIETMKPSTEIPDQIFEEEVTKEDGELRSVMEKPSKDSLALMHEIETKRPPMDIPEQIFDLMHEIETEKPPMEIPEQIFEEDSTNIAEELQCEMEENHQKSI